MHQHSYTAHNPLMDRSRLFPPMFSMGFSARDFKDNTAGRGDQCIGLAVKNGCIELTDDCSVNGREGTYINGAKCRGWDSRGENPNESCRKGTAKFCARGHWKPSEDAKLRELIAVYGPQNWNLIAEKLDGRSGKKIIYCHCSEVTGRCCLN